MAKTLTPTPIPALAPVLSPFDGTNACVDTSDVGPDVAVYCTPILFANDVAYAGGNFERSDDCHNTTSASANASAAEMVVVLEDVVYHSTPCGASPVYDISFTSVGKNSSYVVVTAEVTPEPAVILERYVLVKGTKTRTGVEIFLEQMRPPSYSKPLFWGCQFGSLTMIAHCILYTSRNIIRPTRCSFDCPLYTELQ